MSDVHNGGECVWGGAGVHEKSLCFPLKPRAAFPSDLELLFKRKEQTFSLVILTLDVQK